MNKLMKVALMALVSSFAVGCATNGDVENLQTQSWTACSKKSQHK